MVKERTWPLAPAKRMLWETAYNKKAVQLHIDRQVTVKRCGRFNYNDTKIGFILQKQRKGKKLSGQNWQAALNFILIHLVENLFV